jgi:hypothetical protein
MLHDIRPFSQYSAEESVGNCGLAATGAAEQLGKDDR